MEEVKDALGANHPVQLGDVRLEVDVEKVIWAVGVKDAQAGRISAVHKLRHGSSELWFELQKGAEG